MKTVCNYKTGQIQGRIDNVKLTLVLTPNKKKHKLHLHFMPNQSLINSLNLV